MREVCLDVETYSEADITTVGGAAYMEHPSTAPRCLYFNVDGVTDGVHWEIPDKSFPMTKGKDHLTKLKRLKKLAEDPDTVFVAHNVMFEYRFWHRFIVPLGLPPLPFHRWRCTMAQARVSGLPGKLEEACKALNLPFQKNPDGKRLIKLLCVPTKKHGRLEYDDIPEEFEKLYKYCADDVDATVGLRAALRPLSPWEQRVWEIDQRINEQGLRMDMKLVQKASVIIAKYTAELKEEFEDVTGYEIASPTQRDKFGRWLKKNGVHLLNNQANTLKKYLHNNKPATKIRRAIEIYMGANMTSLAKYKHIMKMTCRDGYMKDIAVFCGSLTGRWTSYGVQWLNLARPKMDATVVIACLQTLSVDAFCFLYDGQLPNALSSATRGMIIADEGYKFLVGDYSQIENRVLAWSAGDANKLKAFRDGQDLYCLAASNIYGREITKADKDERQVGKGSELGFQFGGGINAVLNTCATYGVDLRPAASGILHSANSLEIKLAEWSYARYVRDATRRNEPEIADYELGMAADILKQRWRKANKKTVEYWKQLEDAVVEAIETQSPVKCGKSTWFVHKRDLCCRLPSGRVMHYPEARVKRTKKEWDEELQKEVEKTCKPYVKYRNFDPQTGGYGYLYGGKIAENETQAIANDVERAAMVRCEHKFPVCYHCHDELATQVKKEDDLLAEFIALMEVKEKWMTDLPIKVGGWEDTRYGKPD